MTTTRASPWRSRNARRSASTRATAASGSVRASRKVMPGRISASAAASCSATASGSPVGMHPAVDQPRGPHRERRLDEVVASEDEVAERGQAGLARTAGAR